MVIFESLRHDQNNRNYFHRHIMLNTYTVIMLGPAGSGKTVFLASMEKKLSTQGDLGFFLEIDGAEKRKRLKNIYTQIALDERWPKNTDIAEVSEWTFTCKVQTPNLGIYSACKFQYLDYAGGRLTDEMDFEDSQFDATLKKADAILGLLDGVRIMSLMKNERSGKLWSINDLPNMLEYMQSSNRPIHFLVSKWDIVENYYTLEQVRDCLLEIEEFNNLLKVRRQNEATVRLIPVSSVGSGFAQLQPDGSMLKTGQMPQPFQVETPLACVLPDLVETTLRELVKKKQQEESEAVEVRANLSFWDRVKKYVGKTVQSIASTVQESLPSDWLALEMLEDIIDFVEEEVTRPVYEKEAIARRKTEELQKQKQQSIQNISNEQEALKYAIKCFQQIVLTLEIRFPNSKF